MPHAEEHHGFDGRHKPQEAAGEVPGGVGGRDGGGPGLAHEAPVGVEEVAGHLLLHLLQATAQALNHVLLTPCGGRRHISQLYFFSWEFY